MIRRIDLGLEEESIVEDLQEVGEVEEDEVTEEEIELDEIDAFLFDEIDEKTISVIAYPNPASLFIKFEIDGVESAEFDISILDASGRRVLSDSFSDNSYEIMLNDFIAGYYFYRIVVKEDPKKTVLSGKFVKVD